ncbi:MAG: V-type ATP synthase subunit I [Acidaminococcaceae bacterium]
MKKVTLYALKEDRDALLLSLQKDGNIMFIPSTEDVAMAGVAEIGNRVQRTKEAIRFVAGHEVNTALWEPRLPVSYDEFLEHNQEAANLSEQVEALSEKIASLRNESSTMLAQVEQLQPWLGLDIPLEALAPTNTTTYFAGYLPESSREQFTADIKDLPAEIVLLDEAPEGRAMLVFVHQSAVGMVKHFLKAHEFTDIVFPKRTGLAGEIAVNLSEAARMKDSLANDLEEEAAKIAERKSELYVYYDQLNMQQERMTSGGKETLKTFSLQGWVRSDRQEEVRQAVAGATDAYDLNFEEPQPGEIPPTVMENSRLVEPYEAVTELYSRPQIGAFDPNPIMAPFYFIFFGMMLSDAGYGLVLTVLLFVLNKILKPTGSTGKLTLVILMGSISTVIWGALFGGWFGLEWHPLLFVPMKEPLKMLILCYTLGAMHLVSGMLIKIYMNIKRGQVWDAIFDQAAWLVLFGGLFAMAMLPSPVGKYCAILGAATLVLTGGRAKKGIFNKLLGGLLTLYNISSYVSDLLSYSRLFALGLATGVIAMVINTIAEMLWSAGPVGIVVAVLVLIGGHIFNIMINILGSFVHTSRLQYIEFFGKFFEAGGRAFVPMAIRTKYTDVTK